MWEYYPAATVQGPSPQAMAEAPQPWMQSKAPEDFNNWSQFPPASQGYTVASDALALQALSNAADTGT